MSDYFEQNIGKRIKNLRTNRGLSLRSLADKCGLSANAISLIERGENSPTIASLLRLTEALEISLNDFFNQSQSIPIVHIKNFGGMHIENTNCIIKSLCYGFPNPQIEPYQITINPGADMSSKPIIHPGQEFVYCLSGEIEYFVDNQQFILKKGDSLLFDALHPHGWCNPNKNNVELLLIFHSHSDRHLAHQRHIQFEMET